MLWLRRRLRCRYRCDLSTTTTSNGAMSSLLAAPQLAHELSFASPSNATTLWAVTVCDSGPNRSTVTVIVDPTAALRICSFKLVFPFFHSSCEFFLRRRGFTLMTDVQSCQAFFVQRTTSDNGDEELGWNKTQRMACSSAAVQLWRYSAV